MRNTILIIAGVVFLVVIAWLGSRAFVGIFDSSRNVLNIPTNSSSAPTNSVITPTNLTIAPSPTATAVQNTTQNIVVTGPVQGNMVSSPFIVSGNARVFENVVSIELSDSAGNVLYSGTAYANSPDVGQFGKFEQQVQFVTDASSGKLTVYQASARDGSRIDVVEVPLNFN